MVVVGSALIVGGDSQIGRCLASWHSAVGHRVITTTRRTETLAEHRQLLDLEAGHTEDIPFADVAYLCAGATSLQCCHKHPEVTRRVNVESTVQLAETLVRQGTFVVFPSTNLVFDGTIPFVRADAECRPTTVYGQQKAEAERRLLELGDRVSVVRLTKVLSQSYPLFDAWRRQLKENQCVCAFSDMGIAPIPLEFVVELIGTIGTRGLCGIWQASAREQVSYYEIAQRLADRSGGSNKLVSGVSAIAYEPLNGVVPTHSTLDSRRLSAELGFGVPDSWSTIDRTLDCVIDRSRDE
jgi:dTDP-4-dehydrorhamnose reductase